MKLSSMITIFTIFSHYTKTYPVFFYLIIIDFSGIASLCLIFSNESLFNLIFSQIGEVSINANRSVLAQNSEVFRRMLYTSGLSEAQNVRKTRKRSYQAINNVNSLKN